MELLQLGKATGKFIHSEEWKTLGLRLTTTALPLVKPSKAKCINFFPISALSCYLYLSVCVENCAGAPR